MDMMAMTAMTTGFMTAEDVLRSRLLHAMREKQGSTHDRVFARRLGVPLQALCAAREGKRPIGIPFLFALARAYPDLARPTRAYFGALLDVYVEDEE